MMKKKIEEKAFFNVLKKADLKSPSLELTSSIMEQLQKETLEVANEEIAFSNMLKKANIAEVPDSLSNTILSKLEIKKTSYKPLVSKNVKYVYLTLMSIGIFYLLIRNGFSFSYLVNGLLYIYKHFSLVFACSLSLIFLGFLDVFLRGNQHYKIN